MVRITYLFDVDGVLTPSRGQIDPEFKTWFKDFISKNTVCLVTGSDSDKTIEQLGQDIFEAVSHSFNCCGNVVYRRGQYVYALNWTPPDTLLQDLEQILKESHYTKQAGNHFEYRHGMLNFSVVGRSCTAQQRADYYNWDQINQERMWICQSLRNRYPDLSFEIGGEISIDIFPRGRDKSQVLDYITGPVCFFGDRMEPGGNDHALAQAILDSDLGNCYNVRDWRQTWSKLKEICDA